MTRLIILFCLIFMHFRSEAQFIERLDEGKIAFYLDDHYYLTDRNCQFLRIVREAGFDFQENIFHGPFQDFDLDGRLILEGTYTEGKKNGVFKAYHGSGEVKWETTYVDDYPEGETSFYYPDGMPMLLLKYGERGMEIIDYWDRRGRQRVKNGSGRYEMKIRLLGYNELGATFVERAGRVRNGKPHGLWKLELIFDDNETYFLGYDRFQEGRVLDRVPELNTLLNEVRDVYVPLEEFTRAEFFISKNCNIDEYSGYMLYLQELLIEGFEGVPVHSDPTEAAHFRFKVSAEGVPQELEAVNTLSLANEANYLYRILDEIGYIIPSFLEGNFIEDVVDVYFDIIPDSTTRIPAIENMRITRQKGQ